MDGNLILLIDDEIKLAQTASHFLELNGFQVKTAFSGDKGLELFFSHMHEIDLVLLDIMLPGVGGDEVLREIRKNSNVPVIMMTAKDAIESQINSFKLGADDYIMKPYALSVVKVHIEAVLKRAGRLKEYLEAGGLILDQQAQKLIVQGAETELTQKEYDLLEYFMQNQNLVLKRDMILNSVWGYEYTGDQRTVDTLVKQLRKKLGNYGRYIRSIYGAGYSFEVRV